MLTTNQDNDFVMLDFGICSVNHKSSGSVKTLQFAMSVRR
jgi:hypothetical protein